MLEKIMDIIYPPVCGICGKLDKNWLCRRCKRLLENLYDFKIENYENDKEKYFDEYIKLFQYDGIIRKLMIDYKFKDKAYEYRTIINFIINHKNACEILNKYDIMAPVPVSKKRFKERGYNQSALIAREICKYTSLVYMDDIIEKIKNTVPQSTLDKKQREENAKNVYKLKNSSKITGKKVLLLDDIYTTGNTVNECSKILKEANPKKIGILTIARD